MGECVGIVDSVSSYEVKGYLLDSAPHSVSLSRGGMALFPRVNGFLIIPNEIGGLVGIVTKIEYNHMKSEDDVELPKGLRKITMVIQGHIEDTLSCKRFERGSFSLPTVGDQIMLPTEEELASIVRIDPGEGGTISIGTAPLMGGQEVRIPVNVLFGRHLAVLGNTGSGKSCTVAGLIRRSMEESRRACEGLDSPDARVIVLDPNGEYGGVFEGLGVDVLNYKVQPSDEGDRPLRIPAWMWTSDEWSGLVMASDRTQRPVLREALKTLRSSSDERMTGASKCVRVYMWLLRLKSLLGDAIKKQKFCVHPDVTRFGKDLKRRIGLLREAASELDADEGWEKKVLDLCDAGDNLADSHVGYFTNENGEKVQFYNCFDYQPLEVFYVNVEDVVSGIDIDGYTSPITEDDPIEFPIRELPKTIEDISEDMDAYQYVDFMTVRIRDMLENARLGPVIGNDPPITLLEWIDGYLGTRDADGKTRGKICVIDLSLLPSETVCLMVATVARMVFESLQRYRKTYGEELPTLLVVEEAHEFIHRYDEKDEGADRLCTQTFEQIAREGRKFGLGLVISSQRPAELSQTVLSQCNSFIVHRVVNDKDQDMIRKMAPDNTGDILSELPALPTKQAIVMGSAVNVPTIVDINDIPEGVRPRSETPDFWKAWTGKNKSHAEWGPIVDEWQKKGGWT